MQQAYPISEMQRMSSVAERDLSLLRSIFTGGARAVPTKTTKPMMSCRRRARRALSAVRRTSSRSPRRTRPSSPASPSASSAMSPEDLVQCGVRDVRGAPIANLTDAHAKLRTWKACQRADFGSHEGSALPTFQAAFDKLIASGVAPEAVRGALAAQKVDFVLTAHPTEAQRQTILRKQKRVVELLEEYDRLSSAGTPGELQHCGLIRRELTSAWRTSSVRRTKPTAEGEARNGMAVVEETLWSAVPEHYRRIDRLLQRNGMEALPADAAPVAISSWMGGDRDSNPNVTAHTTRRVVALLRSRAAEFDYRDVDALLYELSHPGPVTDEMAALVAQSIAFSHDPAVKPAASSNKVFSAHPSYGVAKHFHTGVPEDEPYRIVLMAVRRRLYKTRAWAERLYMAGCGGTHDEKKTAAVADDDDVYGSTAELLAPLEVMHRSLVAVGDRILADGALLDLIRVRTFGLALTRLDLRQVGAPRRGPRRDHRPPRPRLVPRVGRGKKLEWLEGGSPRSTAAPRRPPCSGASRRCSTPSTSWPRSRPVSGGVRHLDGPRLRRLRRQTAAEGVRRQGADARGAPLRDARRPQGGARRDGDRPRVEGVPRWRGVA